MSNLILLHQIFICRTYALLQFYKFWSIFCAKLANKELYKASIGGMSLKLPELQETDSKAQELKLKDGYQDIDGVLYHKSLLFVPKAIQIELIRRHHNNLLDGHFGIKKTHKFLVQKYFWPTLKYDVEACVKGCNVYLASKTMRHKPYNDLQSLSVPIHQWKNLSIDFVTSLLISIDWKKDSYNSILVIVDQLTKMVYYELVKITINTLRLAEIIIDMVVWYHGLSNLILTNKSSLLISKFWSLLCYFLGIKRRLSTVFHP